MRGSGPYTVLLGSVLGSALALASPVSLQAQGDPVSAQGAATTQPDGAGGRRGQFAGMSRIGGEVTAVSGATLTIKTENGGTAQVVTTDNTRVMKDRGPVKVADLHPGDGLMAFGNLDGSTKTLHAAMIMATDAATVKAMRENLGKTYITGRVTAIDLEDAKMTVERSDHIAQTIGFDETTSFKRLVRGEGGPGAGNAPGGPGGGDTATPGGSGSGGGGAYRSGSGGGGYGGGMGGAPGAGNLDRAFDRGESITLSDIKVGDGIAGTGSVKNGVFVPTHLLDSPPGQRRQRPAGGSGGAPPSAAPPSASQPPASGPPTP